MTPMMILRSSKERSQRLKPRRTPIRSMLIDHKLPLQSKKRPRFWPFQESHKLKVNSPILLKLVERRRITKELNVVEAAVIEVAAEVAKQEKLQEEAEVVVSILDLVLLTRLMPTVPQVLIDLSYPTNVIEGQMKEKKVPNMRALIKEMALERLVVAEKTSKMVIVSQEVKKLKKNQKRRLKKKLLLRRKRRSLNLNMKKLL